jgi:hypothetical protein
MDHDNDGAINLSTSQRPSACTTPNGSTDFEDADQVGERKFTFFQVIFLVMQPAARLRSAGCISSLFSSLYNIPGCRRFIVIFDWRRKR